MAKQYVADARVRRINKLMKWMSGRGIGATWVLTTTGRVSGEDHKIPVSPITIGGADYIVSPYGEVGWVRNVRADPETRLQRGKAIKDCTLFEVTQEAGAVVMAYWAKEKYARPYMDVPEQPTIGDFNERTAQFPVFRVEAR